MMLLWKLQENTNGITSVLVPVRSHRLMLNLLGEEGFFQLVDSMPPDRYGLIAYLQETLRNFGEYESTKAEIFVRAIKIDVSFEASELPGFASFLKRGFRIVNSESRLPNALDLSKVGNHGQSQIHKKFRIRFIASSPGMGEPVLFESLESDILCDIVDTVRTGNT